jgi:hypothetical protein
MYLSMRAELGVVLKLMDTVSSPCDLRAAVVESSKPDASDSRFFPDRSDNRLCLRLTVCADRVRERNSGTTQEASEMGTSHIDGMISSGPDIEEADVVIDWHPLLLSSWFAGSFRSDSSGRCFCKDEVDATTQDSPSTALSAVRAEPEAILSYTWAYFAVSVYVPLSLWVDFRRRSQCAR